MLSEKRMKIAMDRYMANDFFKEEYENAPSENCKYRIALSFYYSTFDCGIREIKRIEKELDVNDWKYLYRYTPNCPLKLKIKNRIIELGGTVK